MKIQRLVLLPVAVAALACFYVRTNATMLDPTLHLARTCPDAVKLYTLPDRVQQPYREVALLNSTGQTLYSDEGDMMKSMREKAAAVGANGIILGGIEEPNAITKVVGEVARAGVDRTGRAMAIYVAGDSANSVAACAKKR
jgi:hypothetical protein